jgi:elongation factor G
VAGEQLFARVTLTVEPLADPGCRPRSERSRAGAIPAAFLPAILDSMANAANGGGAYGYPVTGIRITLDAATFDEAGQPRSRSTPPRATRSGTRSPPPGRRARAVRRLEIRVPEEYVGAVMKTLQQRRAVVSDTGYVEERRRHPRRRPIGEMFGYLTSLRSHTQGRGSFALEPLDYRPLPDNLVAAHHVRLDRLSPPTLTPQAWS